MMSYAIQDFDFLLCSSNGIDKELQRHRQRESRSLMHHQVKKKPEEQKTKQYKDDVVDVKETTC